MKSILQTSVFIGLLATAAQAQEVNGAWEVHKKDGICYTIAFPNEDSKPSDKATGKRYISVSNRPNEGVKDEVALSSGFDSTMNIEASAVIDGELPVALLAYKGAAFAKSEDTEALMITRMKAGSTIEVKWTDETGEYFVDRYSLSGFTASMKAIQNCK